MDRPYVVNVMGDYKPAKLEEGVRGAVEATGEYGAGRRCV
jgi:hypothetical protein